MQLHAERGEAAQALKLYETLRERLQRELGAKPEPETTRLYDAIREHRAAPLTGVRAQTADDRGLPAPPPLPDKPSVAVLPFENLSGDPEQQYFSDGITEDIAIELSRFRSLFVIARNSSFAFKGRSMKVQDIARELGVAYIVEGSVRRAGERVRINAQLIDAATGNHLWAERFDRDMADIFAVQDEVTAKIVEALVGRLVAPPARKRPTNLMAYDLCVRTRFLFGSAEATREACSLLRRAIELDPGYAEAHRWLAFHMFAGWAFYGEPEEPNRRLALNAAQKAVQLDPNDAGCRWVLGYLLAQDRHWAQSDSEFAAALTLDSNHADAWAILADLTIDSGKTADAIEQIRKALRLNPHPPGWYYWVLGQAQYAAHQYEHAVETLRREETYRTESRRTLAASLAQLGRPEEAQREAELFMTVNPQFRIGKWAASNPFRNDELRQHFIDGYRKAGLPE
jgi:TolB-like protein